MRGSRALPGRSGVSAPLVAVVVLALAGCSDDQGGPAQQQGQRPQGPDNTAVTAPTADPSTDAGADPTAAPTDDAGAPSPGSGGDPSPRLSGVVARGLRVPWGIDFLPDGTALVAERDRATIRRISASGEVSLVGTVPGVQPTSEGGLLGLAVSPAYAEDRTIFVYLTTSSDNRVLSMTVGDDGLGRPREIVTGIPYGEIHDGGRLEFGPDGKLYISTGETGDEDLAQDPDSLGGKILRLDPDGSVPADNPDPGSPVWSSGHRNVQGLAFDADDRLWASEFGSDVWDELNRIEKGLDYGWPAAEGDADEPGLTDPLVQWRPDNASPSGLAFAGGSLWAASLRGERLWEIPLRADGGVGRPRAILVGDHGRLRTVVRAPDGSLWVSTSNHDGRGLPAPADDRILRIALR